MSEALKAAALQAGIIDLDALALADLAKDDGTPEAAAALVASLMAAKPFLFSQKMSRDMTPAEKAAKLAELRKGPAPEPMPVVKAKDLTPAAREAWIREHSRRLG